MNQRLKPSQIQTIFREVFTRHLDKLEAVAARERIEPDFDASNSRRSDRIVGWAYRALETRGTKASVDEHLRASILADGLGESDVNEVAAMLGIMQRQDLARERTQRLKEMVEMVGAEPSPVNLALAQEAVHRAKAEANFQTARRYDGLRNETAAVMDSILSARAFETAAGGAGLASQKVAVERTAANTPPK